MTGSYPSLASPTQSTPANGFRYTERGGILTSLLGLAAASASAQETANATGRSATIHGEGADHPGLGATFEYRSTNRFIADIAMGVPFGSLFELPFVFDFGISAGWNEIGGFTGGLILRLAAPLTQWAQADIETHMLFGGGELQGGLTLFAGNRFFGRAAAIFTPGAGLGQLYSVGVNL